jgi:hypothetical protein
MNAKAQIPRPVLVDKNLISFSFSAAIKRLLLVQHDDDVVNKQDAHLT